MPSSSFVKSLLCSAESVAADDTEIWWFDRRGAIINVHQSKYFEFLSQNW